MSEEVLYNATRQPPPSASEQKAAQTTEEILQRLEDMRVEIDALKAAIEHAASLTVEVPADGV